MSSADADDVTQESYAGACMSSGYLGTSSTC